MIKHIFRFKDKSTIGSLLLSIFRLFFIVFPFVFKSSDNYKIIGAILAIILLVASILITLSQIFDRVLIKNDVMLVRYKLKYRKIVLNKNSKVKMVIDFQNIRRSNFVYITHSIEDQD